MLCRKINILGKSADNFTKNIQNTERRMFMSQSSQKQDRRTRRTRQLLYKGLVELMETKPIQQISVQELTQLCDLNRSTFYLHYSSIYQLLEEMEQELLLQLEQVLDQVEDKPPLRLQDWQVGESTMVQAFEFLSHHKDFCNILISKSGDENFILRITELVQNRCLGLWTIALQNQPKYLANYFFTFVLSGCFAVVEQWLKSGMKESPEELAQMVHRFICTGASSFLD